MRYKETNGILDLAAADPTTGGKPDVFLIEHNARPSTRMGSTSMGFDFFRRLRIASVLLSVPFSCHAQYWCELVIIPIHRKNIAVPDDFFEQVIERLPEIAPYMSRAERITWAKVVSGSGTGFIGYFMMYSRSSRMHLLDIGGHIREVSQKVLDGV
ncbi:hypothetical protein FQN49_003692 [Arthroderma sp. PD_2]|nr:hypothetical protein FQN49_003692 [Arthroderma sp. PD_2]